MPTYANAAGATVAQVIGYGPTGSMSAAASTGDAIHYGVPHVPVLDDYARVVDPFATSLLLFVREQEGDHETPGGAAPATSLVTLSRVTLFSQLRR